MVKASYALNQQAIKRKFDSNGTQMQYKHELYTIGRYTVDTKNKPTLDLNEDVSTLMSSAVQDGWRVIATSLSTPAIGTTFFLFISVTYAKE